MDIKKILLITLIAVAIIASVGAVSAGLFDGLFGGAQDNVIEIDNIAFNITNVTKFEVCNETEDDYGSYKWYMDENKTGYNVHIANLSICDDDAYNEQIKLFKENLANNPSQTINGVVIYTASANVGTHVGEPRYIAYVENKDLNIIVDFWSPDPNETAKMALSLKFK